MKSATSSGHNQPKLNGSAGGIGLGFGNKPEKQQQPDKKQPKREKTHGEDNNKSFGYNVAKSVAYRAYR